MIAAPPGADLPAQLLRVRLFATDGLSLWNNWWYGGHYLLGYSVLFPPLGWLLGARLVAALACVGTAAAFEALAHDVYGEDAWLGATWLGAATVTELLSGRLTFALGLCGAALTALALRRRRRRGGTLIVAVLACLTTLASPVAGLFVALAGAAVGWGGLKVRDQRDIASGIAAISPQIALLGGAALAFPTVGYQPFAFGALWPLLLVGLALLVALGRGARSGSTLRAAVVLYLLGCLAAYALHTPVGSNVARLGQLTAGPLVALLLVPRRAWLLLALSAAPLTYLQVHDAVVDLQHGAVASSASYYRPLLGFLRRRPGSWRVEVPFTSGHWESYWLAAHVPLARGWERQTDTADNRIFYGRERLSPARYDAWLHQLAVRYVAVADAPVDYSARAELRLIRSRPPFLHLVRRLRHWRVYAVADPTPLASGGGRVVAVGPDSLRLAITRAGEIYLRVRWSPYWRLRGVRGCVMRAGQFTRLELQSAGAAQLQMSFALDRVAAGGARCD